MTNNLLKEICARKCKKCGTRKARNNRWIRYENGWQCYDCYQSAYWCKRRKKGKMIEFHTVFEANKAATMFKWARHHHYGSVKFHVSYYMYLKLKAAGVGFWLVDN